MRKDDANEPCLSAITEGGNVVQKPDKTQLQEYHVLYKADSAFAAHARLLQSMWRERHGFPEKRYGNFVETEYARQHKVNFLTDRIGQLVETEIQRSRKTGALISQPRIWDNLLSSQPMCFNLFGELYYNLSDASDVFEILFPDIVEEITSIKFEYSPGRGDIIYTADHSAFDVFVEYNSKEGKCGFIGIEVKYAESLREETKEKARRNFRERYVEITERSGVFEDNAVDVLREPPLSQIWRDHLLAITLRDVGGYDEGLFMFLFPSENKECREGVQHYKSLLRAQDGRESGFYSMHLETVVEAVQSTIREEWIGEFRRRYLG